MAGLTAAPAGRTSPARTMGPSESGVGSGREAAAAAEAMGVVVGGGDGADMVMSGGVAEVDVVVAEWAVEEEEEGLVEAEAGESGLIGWMGGCFAASFSVGWFAGGGCGGGVMVLSPSASTSSASAVTSIFTSAGARTGTASKLTGRLGFPLTVPTGTLSPCSHKQGPSIQPLLPFLSTASVAA